MMIFVAEYDDDDDESDDARGMWSEGVCYAIYEY
jgi:hypothetical protein